MRKAKREQCEKRLTTANTSRVLFVVFLATAFLLLLATRMARRDEELTKHKGPVLAIAFSEDGRYLASGGTDGVVRIFDVDGARQLVCSAQYDRQILRLAFSGEGRLVALLETAAVCVINLRDASLQTQYTLEPGFPVMGFRAPGASEPIQIIGRDRRVFLWTPPQQELTETLEFPSPLGRRLSPDGAATLRAGAGATLDIVSVSDGSIVQRIQLPQPANSCSWSPDGSLVACAHGSRDSPGARGLITIWDISTGAKAANVATFRIGSAVSQVEFSPITADLAYAEYSGKVSLRGLGVRPK